MHLQDRNLSPGLSGPDVQLLHSELSQLGLTVPPAESQAQRFGPGTERAVQAFQATHRLPVSGIVDPATAVAINLAVNQLHQPSAPPPQDTPEFVVQGTVNGFDDGALAGARVFAVDKDLRHEQPLGEAVVDREHRYRITYSSDRFGRAERATADLVVRAVGPDGRALASSAIVFNAPRNAVIDLTVQTTNQRALSEIERYYDTLKPLLEDVGFDGLTENEQHQDITFLAGETGIEPLHIAFIAIAHRDTRAINIPAEAYYAVFRQDLPTNLAALVLEPADRVRTAIERSVAENIVPAWVRERSDEIVRTLLSGTGQIALNSDGGGTFRLGRLLATAALPQNLQEKFINMCQRGDLAGKEFWDAVRSDPDLARNGAAEALAFTVQAGGVTLDNVPLVGALQSLRQQGIVHTVRDLVKFSPSEWETQIRSANAPIPPEIPGDTEAERLTRYVDAIVDALKQIFPTDVVAQGVARELAVDTAVVSQLLARNPRFDVRGAIPDSFDWADLDPAARDRATAALEGVRRELNMFPQLDPHSALSGSTVVNPFRRDLAHFLANAPEFDFETSHIDTFLSGSDAANGLAGVSNRAALADNLKRFQRVFQFAPRYDHMQVLLGRGVHSAFGFASIPLKNAIREFSPLMGGEMAVRSAYSKASHKAAVMTNLTASIQHGLHDNIAAAGGGGVQNAYQKIPSLATLFGSADLCECEHCRSVYGPAAYFVDLLQFLRKSSYAPFARLMARRPDLQHIKLTCENTNTRLPYLDLVNEILESYVAHEPNALDATTAKDTTSDVTEAELSVNPQYTIDAAYEKLLGAVHGSYLPFNRPVEVARAYLEHLGASRYEVLSTFQTYGTPLDPADPDSATDPASKDPPDGALAREYLKIAPQEYDILVGASPEPTWRFFGYTSPDFVDDTWQGNLTQVPSFLRRTGIEYDDLVALLRTRYINPVQTPDPKDLPADAIVLFSPNSVCDLSATSIRRLGNALLLEDAAWLRIHRFLRLWRKLGWTMQELDAAMHALNATEIDAALIENLARVQRLKTDVRQPIIQLLTLWAPIDTFDSRFQGKSFYHSLFRNRAVINDAAYTVFALNESGSELADPTALLEANLAAVQAALRVSAADLTLLREATALDAPQTTIALANLSRLYRHAFLARALKVKVRDYILLSRLLDVQLAAAANPAQTVRFVERTRGIKESEFNAAQLTYLFRHLSEPPSTVAPIIAGVVLLLSQLQDGLRRVLAETALVPDPTGELLHARLAMLLDAALVVPAIAIIERTSPMAASEQEAFVDQHFTPFLPNLAEAKSVIFAPLLDPQSGPSAAEIESRRNYVYPRLTSYLRDFLSRALVKQTLADALKLEGAAIQLLLETVLRSRVDPSKPAIADFLALVGDGLSVEYFANTSLADPPALTRVEPSVNAYFGSGSPDLQLLPPGAFSARWTGYLLAQQGESYTFYVRAKDGVRLWIGDMASPVIDAWTPQSQPIEQASGPVTLAAGQIYPIRLEYFAAGPDATVELRWSSLSTPKAIIPQSHLYSGTTFVPLEGLLRTYESVYKVALLIRGFRITAPEAAFLFSHGADFGDLDPNEWPVERVDPAAVDDAAPTLLAQWERLRRFFVLRDALPRRDVTLIDVISAPTAQDARTRLASMTGWDATDVEFLAGATGLALPDVSFRAAAGPARLLAAFALARRLGIAVVRLHTWAHTAPDAAQAREIVQTVKARYGDEEWIAAAKPLNDALRERQRNALVAYVLTRPEIVGREIENAEQLFEHFLIDVSMGACMDTSRIKQAISSVQLFVHRCLLGLEQKQPLDQAPGVTPDMIDDHRWEWMRNYRVWEANRKVFLYPENWMEPELRDDRSPFFRELEAQLLQQEITPDAVEQAYRDYLHKLDEVARLEICAVYSETNGGASSGTPSVVHIFGRTHNSPAVYYYRRLLVATGVWTAWERVPLDIQSEHLIPAVYNRRLYLFWATFEQKADPKQDLSGPPLVPPKTPDEIAYEECQKKHDAWQGAYEKWDQERAAYEALMELYGQSVFYPVPPPEEPICTAPAAASPPTAKPPATQWEIKLSWSDYRRPPGPPTQTTEHRPGRWSPAQRAKDVVISKVYTLNGSEHYPALDDHFFNVVENEGGDLVVMCLRRLKKSPDPVYVDSVQMAGFFYMSGCHGTVGAVSLPGWPAQWNTPDRSRFRLMRFDQQLSGETLTFYGASPEYTTYSVLDNTPTRFQLVHPPVNVQPKPKGFAHTIYPFAYQDGARTYLALPALEKERPSRQVIEYKPDFEIDVTDAVASKFKYIEKGDPGPEEKTSISDDVMDAASIGATGQLEGFQMLLGGGAAVVVANPPQMTMKKWSGSGPEESVWTLPDASSISTTDAVKKMKTLVRFHTLHHPHVCEFVRALNQQGIAGLVSLDVQRLTNDPSSSLTLFRQAYEPTTLVHWSYPKADVDFGHPYGAGGAYSVYNWELFFHIPMMIADRLSANQKFDDAQKWFHLIFNPTTTSSDPSPMRYWVTLPFHENTKPENEQIVTLLMGLHSSNKAVRDAITYQIEQWRDNPFNPYLIARLRITAYQKAVVMKYIDNLIAWGDQLFSRDTIESINEATQLYVLAHHLLMPWPQHIPRRGIIESKTYADLQSQLDAFSNALVTLQNEFPFSSTVEATSENGGSTDGLGMAQTFYFCIPDNEELQRRRTTVQDRLLKIRSCMNIEGIVRQLPLFEPPIDPALLVKATAMGLDLGSVLNDVNAPLPPYRFQTLLRQAFELCGEVKSLGAALLAALEKGDAEELAALRAGHESAVLRMVRDVKRGQLQDAQTAIAALELTRDTTDARRQHYADLLKAGLSSGEKTQLRKLDEANEKQSDVTFWELSAQAASNIPDATLGTSGSMSSPVLTASFGGHNAVANAQAFARHLSGKANDLSYHATKSSIEAGHERRAQDWTLQKTLAEKELLQIGKQVAGAQIRAAIAAKDLESHDQQIENAGAVEEFLRSKYTNQDLYGWMQSQISAVFFQTYKLAYDVAKRAERAYRFERGLTSSNFVQFGYWDGIRRGLLAGERLFLDLKRMEIAYTDGNRREYEISKQVSLLMHDAHALLTLKETGVCEFDLREQLLDDDYPGHYMRRLKSVALTVPCVIGPYVGLNCTLTMLTNRVRVDGNSQMPYYIDGEDSRFVTNFGAVQSTATSHGRSDAGTFEVNFHDERYLPFEGAGAETRWRLEMPRECNGFDFATISDVILTLNYTAREGGKLLWQRARDAVVVPERDGLQRLFSLKTEFPNEWYLFLHPNDGASAVTLDLGTDRFPFRFRNRDIEITEMEVFVKPRSDGADPQVDLSLTAPDDEPNPATDHVDLAGTLGSLRSGTKSYSAKGPGKWTLSGVPVGPQSLADTVGDLSILCRYSVSALS
jgi:hypothetical protein